MVLVCQIPVHQIHIIMGSRIQIMPFFLSHLMELSIEIPRSCRVPCFSMCPILQLQHPILDPLWIQIDLTCNGCITGYRRKKCVPTTPTHNSECFPVITAKSYTHHLWQNNNGTVYNELSKEIKIKGFLFFFFFWREALSEKSKKYLETSFQIRKIKMKHSHCQMPS